MSRAPGSARKGEHAAAAKGKAKHRDVATTPRSARKGEVTPAEGKAKQRDVTSAPPSVKAPDTAAAAERKSQSHADTSTHAGGENAASTAEGQPPPSDVKPTPAFIGENMDTLVTDGVFQKTLKYVTNAIPSLEYCHFRGFKNYIFCKL